MTVGYPPTLARALHALAQTQSSLALPEAPATLHRTFVVALEAGANDVSARVAADYAQEYGVAGNQLDRGARWADIAESLAQRPGAHPHVQTAVDNVRATIAVRRGDDDEALRRYQALLAGMEAEGEGGRNRGAALMNLGVYHARRDELDLAARYLKEAVELTVEDLGPKHPEVLAHKSNLSRLLVMRHDYGAGREAAREVLVLQREAFGDRHPTIAETLETLAIASRHLGDLAQAEQSYRDSLSQKREFHGPDDPGIADTLRNLAMVRDELGFPEQALALAVEANAMTKRLPPSPMHEATGDMMVGIYLVNLKRCDEALPLLRRASEFFDKDVRHRVKSMETQLQVGQCYRADGDEERALKTFEVALALAESDSWPNLAAWPLVYLAESLRALKRDPKRALEAATRARALAKPSENVDLELDRRLAKLLDQ